VPAERENESTGECTRRWWMFPVTSSWYSLRSFCISLHDRKMAAVSARFADDLRLYYSGMHVLLSANDSYCSRRRNYDTHKSCRASILTVQNTFKNAVGIYLFAEQQVARWTAGQTFTVPPITLTVGPVSYISILFLFPVKDGKLNTGVNAQRFLLCYG